MSLSQEDTQRFLSEPRNVILGTVRKGRLAAAESNVVLLDG